MRTSGLSDYICLFLKTVREVPFEVLQFCITFSTFTPKMSQLEFHDLGHSEEKNKMGLVLVSLIWRDHMNNITFGVFYYMVG